MILTNPLVSLTSMTLIFLLSLILGLVTFIPFLLLLNWGAYFTVYIKGQSIKANMFVELATDIAHLLSFFLRINIQLIRLVIFAGVSYTYSELYLELVYPYINTNVTDLIKQLPYNNIHITINNLILIIAHILFEIGHF
jgi:hypothetical protein